MANPLLEFTLYPSGAPIIFNAQNIESLTAASGASTTLVAGGESYEVTGLLDAIVHAVKQKVAT